MLIKIDFKAIMKGVTSVQVVPTESSVATKSLG